MAAVVSLSNLSSFGQPIAGLFLSLTAGAGTRCMSLLSSSPNLLSKGKRLLDKGSPDSQKKVDRVLEIQEWERRKREGKVLRVLLLEYAKELGIDSLSNTC